MKLDRNTNPDGRGKYALINLRTNKVEWGGEDQFFVVKYKDRFAADALFAYANACRYYAENCGDPEEHREYHEFADEVEREAVRARNWPNRKLPT